MRKKTKHTKNIQKTRQMNKTTEQNKRTKQTNKPNEQNKRTKQTNKTNEQTCFRVESSVVAGFSSESDRRRHLSSRLNHRRSLAENQLPF